MNLISSILSKQYQNQKTLIITSVVSLLVMSSTFYFIFLPALKGAGTLSKQIKEKKKNLSTAQPPSDEYSLLEDKVKGEKEELDTLKKRIFWEVDISNFLNTVTQLASELQIEFVSLKPEKREPSPSPSEKGKKVPQQSTLLTAVPIAIIIRGSYGDLIKFLKRVEEADKLININTLNIEADRRNIYRHSIKIGLGIFNKNES